MAAGALWLGLCASGVVGLARLRFPAHDCAPPLRAELETLRASLPPRSVVFYAGPLVEEGCSPYYLAQHALAPALVLAVDRADVYLELRDSDLVVTEQPAVVLAFGREGRRWLQAHPDYLPARRAGDAVLAVRR